MGFKYMLGTTVMVLFYKPYRAYEPCFLQVPGAVSFKYSLVSTCARAPIDRILR